MKSLLMVQLSTQPFSEDTSENVHNLLLLDVTLVSLWTETTGWVTPVLNKHSNYHSDAADTDFQYLLWQPVKDAHSHIWR